MDGRIATPRATCHHRCRVLLRPEVGEGDGERPAVGRCCAGWRPTPAPAGSASGGAAPACVTARTGGGAAAARATLRTGGDPDVGPGAQPRR